MRYFLIGSIIVASIIIIVVGLWASVLLIKNPLDNPISRFIPWPVACTTRGCISTLTWHKELDVMKTFAQATGKEEPTAADALNTLIRQELSHFGQLRNPITKADAQKYRENILNLKKDETVQTATGLSLNEYDTLVIMPFLEQESLRQQLSLPDTSALYKKLAAERTVVVLPIYFKWDSSTGKITQ